MASKGDETEQPSAPGTKALHAPRGPKQPEKNIVAEGMMINGVIIRTKQIGQGIDVRQNSRYDDVVSDGPFSAAGVGDQPAKRGVAFKMHSR